MKEIPFRVQQTTALEKWRVETFWDKEPETINWISCFRPGDTFLDIGANIGLYSLYAAKRGAVVTAIEPHKANFNALALNTRLLNRALGVRTIWAAVGAERGTVHFQYDECSAGCTGGQIERSEDPKTPIYCWTVDALSETYGPFDHIKIDVDGLEKDIVAGMAMNLSRMDFSSCLIEVGPDDKDFIIDRFEEAGYSLDSPLNFVVPHSRFRRAEEGIDVENLIFVRGDLCNRLA